MSQVEVEESLKKQGWQWDDTIACAAITLACMVLGLYACSLNHTLYTHKAPFYDSLAYNQALADTMAQSANLGVLPALRGSMNETTVYFPSIVASLIGPFAKPQRDIGVWIQIAELALLSLSLYFLLRRVLHLTVMLSASLVLPVLSLKCYFQMSGGLSDFRMDLSLMLMFGITCLWYLIASSTNRTGHFAILGLVAGIAILFRATAPVYLVIALGPCILLDILTSPRRVSFACRLVLAGLVAILVGGWFLIVNYKYLYYYYVVWNIDAHAKLPLAQSSKHIEFVADHVGNRLFLGLGLLLVISLGIRQFIRLKSPLDIDLTNRRFAMKAIKQMCLVWLAISPAAMLVLKGAGLNPYVSMPSSLGIVLVAVICIGQLLANRTSKRIEMVTFALFSLLMVFQAHAGLAFHSPGATNTMNAHKQVIHMLVQDAKSNRMSKVRYGVSYYGEMTAMSLRNVMTLDMHSNAADTTLASHDFIMDGSWIRYAPADWDSVQGETMEAKIASVAASSKSTADYMIMPEPETVEFLTTNMVQVVCDKYAKEIRKQLLETEVWVPISEVIKLSENEKIRVFKNSSTD